MINKWTFKSYSALINRFPLWYDWWSSSVNNSIYIWDNKTKKWVLSNNSKFYDIQVQIDNTNIRIDDITDLVITTTDLILNETHHKIVCDATNNDITIILPTAIWIQWKQYVITRIDNSSYSVIIQPQSWETLYWDNSQEVFQYETLDFTSDNTNYN